MNINFTKLDARILAAILIIISYTCWSQETKDRIAISIPTIHQEATSIWKTIYDIQFFERYGYSINLPKGKLIDSLLVKSKKGTFGNQDFSAIYEFLESDIYTTNDYLAAYNKVLEQELSLNKIIQDLDSLRKLWNWDFKMFEEYKVVITLYGSCGSYDQETGIITLFATKEGDFKLYSNPANTIIHEIFHIGIEESIVKKYHLNHTLKEWVVDKLVYLLFKEELPEYRIQKNGVSQIDQYLREKKDIENLNKILVSSL